MKKDRMNERYVESRRHTIQVDYVPFMNELSRLIGSYPDIKSILMTDPWLGWAMLFGPCLPYQYRLAGFNPWKDARMAIMTVWDRIYFPTEPKRLKSPMKHQSFNAPLIGVLLFFLFLVYIFIF